MRSSHQGRVTSLRILTTSPHSGQKGSLRRVNSKESNGLLLCRGNRKREASGRRKEKREGPSRVENLREKGQPWLPGEQGQLRVLCEVPGWSSSTHASSALSTAPSWEGRSLLVLSDVCLESQLQILCSFVCCACAVDFGRGLLSSCRGRSVGGVSPIFAEQVGTGNRVGLDFSVSVGDLVFAQASWRERLLRGYQ